MQSTGEFEYNNKDLIGQQGAWKTSVKTPMETEMPPEIAEAVGLLEQRIKENRHLAEKIASVDSKMFDQLDSSYRLACFEYGKALAGAQKVAHTVKLLKVESRQDLLDGEMAQRLRDGLAINFEYAAPLNYLLRLASNYENMIVAYAEELHRLEKLIFGQQKTISFEEIAAHLKNVDSALRYVTSRVYEVDKKLQELKDTFKGYRQSVYGDAAKFFPSKASTTSLPFSKFDRLEGPSPFSSSSNSALLVIANALSRAQAGTGFVPNIGLQMPQQTFGTQPLMGFGLQQQQQQPLLGFGLQQQQQPFSTSQTLFRPFGTAVVAPTVAPTSSTPFASGTLSFSSGLGSTATTTTSIPTATSASPWRFSSPFNTSSSGTLFGGTATNVGAVKPLGLATPLQQGVSPAAASLQLLNPPLGSKRGKS